MTKKKKEREGKIGVHVYIKRDFHKKIEKKLEKDDINTMAELLRVLLRNYIKDGK